MALIDDLKSACPSTRENEPLAKHTSFAIGGPARWYADVNTRDELKALHAVVERHHLPVFFLGAGSNILVADGGMNGLVIHLQGDFRKVTFDGANVSVGAGAWLPQLAKQCAERGLAGVESLIGVPGTIGGGVVMNAGTRDGVLGDVVASIEILNAAGEYERFPGSKANFSYRHSKLEGSWVAGATLLLRPEEPTSIMSRLETYLRYRSQTQPLATNNCGSVFKNPPDGAAAKWVEQAGLKGKSIGGARVSERHANFIINEKGASAADVRALIEHIQSTVRERFSVELQPEVKLVGEWTR